VVRTRGGDGEGGWYYHHYQYLLAEIVMLAACWHRAETNEG
jgi:hypothetical protein